MIAQRWLSAARLGVAFAAVWPATACHRIAGDFEVDPTLSTGTGATGSADTPSARDTCNVGEVRCKGAELQLCDPAADPPWLTTKTCPSATKCDAQAGLCHVCDPGQSRCTGWQLETCNEEGSDYEASDQCTSSVYCSAQQGRCLTCLAGEARCDGATLRVCNAARDGWVTTQCESSDLCNARSQACRPCAPGELQCSGTTLQLCTADYVYEPIADCATSELCDATVQAHPSTSSEGWTGGCEPPRCDPGTYQCADNDGRQLLGCPPSQIGWEVVDTCDTAALCDAEAGMCQVGCGPGVSPGSYRCEGAELQLCSLDGTHFETVKTCATAHQCNATRQDCLPCVEGEFQCSGATLLTCTADSTWATERECASAALCDAQEGRCDPGCVEGTYSCEGNVLRRCGADHETWETVDYCVTDALCDAEAGHCNPPGCPEGGAVDCAGNVLRTCPSSLVAWEELQVCPEGWLCDAENELCTDVCPSPPFQCQLGVPFECRTAEDGTLSWQATGPPCTTSALCQASEWGAWCLQPVCEEGEYQCTNGDPQVLQTCATGRDRWSDVAVCEGTVCDDEGRQCDLCVANDYSCSGAELTRCGPSGQSVEDRGTCRDADHCYADGADGYCYLCDPGETQCSGTNQIQDCATDRRAFAAPVTCENGCQDNAGNADYCAGCPIANEVQCVEEDRPGSTRVCPADRRDWDATQECAAGFGCVNNGFADYCAGTCTPNQSSCVETTGVHTCAANGKGFSATQYECADTTSLKRCVGGALSESESELCALETPFCVDGACVECTGTTRECDSGTTTRRECVNGAWQTEDCWNRQDGNKTCYKGNCTPCNDASFATCASDDTRRRCVEGAWDDTPCTDPTPLCKDGSCVGCLDDEDCPPTQSCSSNSCTCDEPLELCGEVCVDTQTDASHCGVCEHECADPTGTCAEGECVACALNGDCPATGQTCVDGECQCPNEQQVCDASCVDLSQDDANCGRCGKACPVSQQCEGGTCACIDSLTMCGETCVDTQTDASHCGVCEHECADPTGTCAGGECVACALNGDCPATGQTCVDGACQCPDEQQVCEASCVDTTSSDAYCGDCFTHCTETPTTPHCLDSACVECRSSDDCETADRPFCDDVAHVCVECLGTSDCTNEDQCQDGECQPDLGGGGASN